ncbi:MAG: CDP-alcohol phosphatidyltransferase family protein [Comamonas sp.]|nr:CDP-alcohol phosphatidyltransferase family protein [Comamonas sp.]
MAPDTRHELLLILPAGFLSLVAVYALLGIFPEFRAEQWLLQASLLWSLVWQQIWQRSDKNRSACDSKPYPALGWANRLTLLRGGLIAATGGFLFQPESPGALAFIPALVYSIAAILDRIDGFIARRSRQTSLMGSELDMVFDALGLLVAPLLAVGYGRIHWSFLLVSAAYYLFRWGLHWRRQHGLPVYELAPNSLRRALAGFQMGFIAVVLWPLFGDSTPSMGDQLPLTQLAGLAFMVPVLTGFAVDWLAASGRVSPERAPARRFFEKLQMLSALIFQPGLRIVAFVSIVMFVVYKGGNPENLFAQPATANFVLLFCAVSILLGLAARVASLLAVILLASLYQVPHTAPLYIATICVVWIMLLGSGRFSLWQWDDRWVNRYDGA